MRGRLSVGIVVWLFLLTGLRAVPVGAETPLPAGVPKGVQKATVVSVVDGDTIKVSMNSKGTTIELAGIDAPEKGECYADDSRKRLQELTQRPSQVYVEESGVPNDNGLTGFVWIEGKDGGKAQLLSTKLVREGFAGYFPDPQLLKYANRIATAEADAQAAGKGVWGKCATLHEALPGTTANSNAPAPTPAPAAQGLTADEQAYIDGASAITTYLSPSFTDFSALMSLAAADTLLFIDTNWKFQVALCLATWKHGYIDGQALTPPESLASVHSYFLEALRLYDQAADVIAPAFDTLDFASMEYGVSLIDQGNDMIDLASAELATFRMNRGL